MHRSAVVLHFTALIALGVGAIAVAAAATPTELAAAYSAQAGVAADASRGQKLFTERHGREWSCASCHGSPSQVGKHAATGKAIGALAPAANPDRFVDMAKVEKWFRRNCNDVMARECTPAEKADVLAWLLTVQP